MTRICFFSQILAKNILSQQIAFEELGDITGIILLNKQTGIPKNFIGIAEENVLLKLLPSLSQNEQITLFVASGCSNAGYMKEYPGLNFIVTNLNLYDLYNKMNALICNTNLRNQRLEKALYEGANLSQILALAGNLIEAPVFLLNSGLKILGSSSEMFFEDKYVTDILEKGYLSYETNSLLFHEPVNEYGSNYHIIEYSATESTHCYLDCEISTKNTTIAHLFLVTTRNHLQYDIGNFCIHLAKIVKKFLLEKQTDIIENTALLSTFATDIFEGKLSESVEIEERIKLLPHPLGVFHFIVTIRFDMKNRKQKIPYSYIINQLEEIFPDCNITVYQHDICIFYWQNHRSFANLDFDHDLLSTLLLRYQAYAGVSNGSRSLCKLRTLYLLSIGTVHLGLSLLRDAEKKKHPNILYYEEYSSYYVIDLAVQKFIQIHGHDDIIYLAHPSIIALCRYDKEHHSDLRSVLFYYLLNDRSISRTATVLYMHRNTIQNKINKISSIITIPLNDGYTQQRMIFSCLLMRYYENYMNNEVNL